MPTPEANVLAVSNLFPPHVRGGAELVAANLCERLGSRGYGVRVLTTRTDRGPAIRDTYHGVEVLRVWPGCAFMPPPDTARSRYVLSQLRAHVLDLSNPFITRPFSALVSHGQCDVLHTHNLYGLSPHVWRLAKGRGIPVVHTAHDAYLLCPKGTLVRGDSGACSRAPLLCRLFRWWYMRQTRFVDVLCCPSTHHLELHRDAGCRAAETVRISNGVVDAPAPAKDRPARAGGILRVAYLGGLAPHKGILTLLDAVRELPPKTVELSVGGTGVLDRDVRRKADALPGVTVCGPVAPDRRAEWLRRHDVLVFPSTCAESFGMSIAEALTQGLPVVVSAAGGQQELVSPGANGLLVPPGDVHALGKALERLAADPGQLARLRRGARLAAGTFSPDRMVDAYAAAYERVCNGQ